MDHDKLVKSQLAWILSICLLILVLVFFNINYGTLKSYGRFFGGEMPLAGPTPSDLMGATSSIPPSQTSMPAGPTPPSTSSVPSSITPTAPTTVGKPPAGITPTEATSSGSGDVKPWPSTCDEQCPIITVYCNAETYCKSGSACADPPPKCAIHLSKDMCSLFDFTDGQQITGEDFRTITQCQREGVPEDPNYVSRCCAIRHEYAHLCDPRDWSESKERCTEVFAENYEHVCIMETINFFCGGEPPRWSDQTCKDLCKDAERRAYIKIWDACMCLQLFKTYYTHYPINSNDCCECYKKCLDFDKAIGLIPPACVRDGWLNSPDKYCDSIAGGSAPHGCDYYGGDPKFNPDGCFKCPPDYPNGVYEVVEDMPKSEKDKQELIDKKCESKGYSKGKILFSYKAPPPLGGSTDAVKYCCNRCPPKYPLGPHEFAQPCKRTDNATLMEELANKGCEYEHGKGSKGKVISNTTASCYLCLPSEALQDVCRTHPDSCFPLCSDGRGGFEYCCSEVK